MGVWEKRLGAKVGLMGGWEYMYRLGGKVG